MKEADELFSRAYYGDKALLFFIIFDKSMLEKTDIYIAKVLEHNKKLRV